MATASSQSQAATIINSPLKDIIPPAPEATLSAPRTAVAGKSTSSWAREWLSRVNLQDKPWGWKVGLPWKRFQNKLESTGLVNACIPDRMLDYPRSEADVGSLIDSELLSVVHRVGKGWLPEPPRRLEWKVEVISEAYAKSSPGRSAGGVRVDKIFIASAKEAANIMWTRSMGKVDDTPSLPKYIYVPRGQLWEEPSSGTTKKTPPKYVDIGRPKALVAIEIKNYGLLDDAGTILEALGNKAEYLGSASSQVPNSQGIRAVMQQALRYAHYYGTQYLYVTDFKTGILLNVPAFAKGESARVSWAVVGAKDGGPSSRRRVLAPSVTAANRARLSLQHFKIAGRRRSGCEFGTGTFSVHSAGLSVPGAWSNSDQLICKNHQA